MLVAHLALKRALVDPQALEDCLAEQQQPPHSPLGQILVRRRLMSPSDLLQLMRASGNVVVSCAGCRKTSPYDRLDPTRSPQCQACGGKLSVSFAGSTRARGPLDVTRQDPSSGRLRPETPRRDTRRESDSKGSDLHGSRLLSGENVIGGTFAGYEIVEEIGRGGMGVVYKVRQPNLDRHVALKVLLGGDLASRTQVARFQREAEIAGRLKHPNIVQIHDVGVLGEHHYFTMDLVEGLPLSKLIKRRQVGIRRAVEISRDVARGLAHAHKREVMHRDIKPDNIIIDREGNAVITDFGLARHLEIDEATRLTRTGALVGTPFYMSPEQAAGKTGEIGEQSDIYALGVVLFELLCFELPFVADNQVELTRRIVNDEPPSLSKLEPSVDRDLETIVYKALAKSTRDRYGDANDMADDLERFLRGEAIRARRQNPLLKLARRVDKHRRVVLASLIGGLSVAAVVIAVVAFVRAHEPPVEAPPAPPSPQPQPPDERALAQEAAERARDAVRLARRTPAGVEHRSALEAGVRSLTQALSHELNQSEPGLLLLRGRAQERLRRGEAAAQDYARALSLAPEAVGDPEAAFLLARLQLREGRRAEALKGLEAQAKRSARGAWHDLILSLLSQERDDDPAAALDSVTRARERDPLVPESYLLEGMLQLRRGATAEARRALEKAVELDPKSAIAWANLARIRRADDPALGRDDLARALELDPENELGLRLQAAQLSREGRVEDAIVALRRLLERHPKDADVLFDLARLYARAQQSGLASQMLSRLQEQAPLDPRPYETRAFARLYALEFSRCLAELSDGMRAVSDSKEASEHLRALFMRLAVDARQLTLGEAWIRDQLAQRPGDPDVLTFRVRLLIANEREQDAEALLEQLRSAHPKHAGAWQTELQYGLSEERWTTDQIAQRLAAYEQAFAQDAEGLSWLAKLHSSFPTLVEFAKAERYAKQVLVLAPDHVLARVVLALVAMDRRRPEEARRHLHEALTREPNDLDALAILGVVEFNLRNLAEAEQALRAVLDRDPYRANAMEGLALCLARTDRFREAAAACLRFVDLCEAVKRSPDPRVLEQLAAVMIKLGRREELFRRLSAIAAREEHPDFKVLLAAAHARAGSFGETRRILEETLEAHPGHPSALQLLKQLDQRGN